MSALGQKQTCAAQKGMSALPPEKRTFAVELICAHSLACFDPQWPNFKLRVARFCL